MFKIANYFKLSQIIVVFFAFLSQLLALKYGANYVFR